MIKYLMGRIFLHTIIYHVNLPYVSEWKNKWLNINSFFIVFGMKELQNREFTIMVLL